jgi:SulP family sulfate permease
MLRRSGQVETIGEEQIFRHKGDAIQAIYSRLDSEICRSCTARVFSECHIALPDGTPRSLSDRELTARAATPTAA